jgi:holo-[acyl-carrier protein] synthase
MLIGVDITEMERIARLAENPAFVNRVYTQDELSLVQQVSEQRKFEILAGRFAVKEAVAKAFGTGIAEGLSFQDIETVRGSKGEPVVSLHGKARELADSIGVRAVRVSLSHASGLAIAFVVLEV